jgi:hypothetical protein
VEDWLHTGSLGALAFGQFVPAALLTGVRMLLRHGITVEPGHLEKGQEVALKTLEQLDGLRGKLQVRLEEELAKAELRWGSNAQPSDQFVQLRLAAQKLADQLSQVEELEARLERMVEGKEALSPMEPLPLPRSARPRRSQPSLHGPEL